jgi:hypothetical protein
MKAKYSDDESGWKNDTAALWNRQRKAIIVSLFTKALRFSTFGRPQDPTSNHNNNCLVSGSLHKPVDLLLRSQHEPADLGMLGVVLSP